MRSCTRPAALVWVALMLVGCDDGIGGSTLDIGLPDTALPITDLALPRDRATAPDASLGQPCTDGADCPSGFCVAHDDGRRVCTERCGNDADCPDDWLCRQVSNAGPDVTFICVPEASPCGGVDLERDPDNCGACGERCAYAFAEAVCEEGACAMGPCLEGHHDLDDDPASGCEYACTPTRGGLEVCDEIDNDCDGAPDEGFDLAMDADNCGACGALCERANAEVRCAEGRCETVACLDGYRDADGDADNGCEAPACVPAPEVCDGDDDDCDELIDEGFDLSGDPLNCGDCGRVCRLANAAPACAEGACAIEACSEGFVDLDRDPANGCESLDCEPLPEVCNGHDDDCDGRIDEAFDVQRDPVNCGGCGVLCAPVDAVAACIDGACAIAECREGFVDLDGAAGNGCECRAADESCNGRDDDCDGMADEDFDLAADLRHCGACDAECRPDNAVAACLDGVCAVDNCRDGAVDLDGDAENGCEYLCRTAGAESCDGSDNDCDGAVDEGFDLAADPLNCGGCARVCAFANAEVACVEGACRAGACADGFVDLDGMPGCEYACAPRGAEGCNALDDDCDGRVDEGFDLSADADHCGACGRVCAFANAGGVCVGGDCQPGACAPGFLDLDGIPGCEYACVVAGEEICNESDDDCDGRVDEGFDLSADADHCGACGRICAFANARAECVDGGCRPGPCEAGFFDLDGIPGCEYACVLAGDEACNERDDDCDGRVDEGLDLDADPEHCGRCGRSCAADQAETACIDGDCRLLECDGGFVDLDGDLQTGCEYACEIAGAETCDEADDDCDGRVDEGFDLQNDPAHCGLCGLTCAFLNAAALCIEGRCMAGPCAPGFVDNDDLPGCEYACAPAPDGMERCNGADDDCDGIVDEQELAPCPADRSGDFLVEADPPQMLVGGILPIEFIPAILTLNVQPPDVDGSMDGPDGQPILYVGAVDGDLMDLTASYLDPAGLQHDETWQVSWDGVDRFDGIMTDRLTLPGFGLFDVVVWNVSGVRR